MELKAEKEFKRQVCGTLEDYGFFQKYKTKEWDRKYRDRFVKDILIVCKRFRQKPLKDKYEKEEK